MSISSVYGQGFGVYCNTSDGTYFDFHVPFPIYLIVKSGNDETDAILYTDEERDNELISYASKWIITHLNLSNFECVEANIPGLDGKDRIEIEFKGFSCRVTKL